MEGVLTKLRKWRESSVDIHHRLNGPPRPALLVGGRAAQQLGDVLFVTAPAEHVLAVAHGE
jgi:hypothetical protein